MNARVICLACAVLARDSNPDPWFRYGWAVACVCGGVAPETYRALRAQMNAAQLAAERANNPQG